MRGWAAGIGCLMGIVVGGATMMLVCCWTYEREIKRLTAERDRLCAMLGYPDEDTGA